MNFELNEEKVSVFRELINYKQSLFYKKFKKKWNLLCAIMDRLEDTASLLNRNQATKSKFDRINEVINFFVYTDIILNSIKKLYEYFNIIDEYPANDCKIFKKIGRGGGSDDAYFRYLRALVFAHPIGTNRHKIYLEDEETQYCSQIISDGSEVEIIVYSNIKEKDFNSIHISLKKLKEYVQSRFNLLDKISDHVRNFADNLCKKRSSTEIKVEDSPLKTLRNLREAANNMGDEDTVEYVDRAIKILKQSITNKNNIERVKAYQKRIIDSIDEVVKCYQVHGNDGIDKSKFSTLVALPRKGKLAKYVYSSQLKRIRAYLQDCEQNNFKNAEFIYDGLKEFNEKFLNKYVVIDKGISPSEILLLIDVAIYCYLEENKLL